MELGGAVSRRRPAAAGLVLLPLAAARRRALRATALWRRRAAGAGPSPWRGGRLDRPAGHGHGISSHCRRRLARGGGKLGRSGGAAGFARPLQDPLRAASVAHQRGDLLAGAAMRPKRGPGPPGALAGGSRRRALCALRSGFGALRSGDGAGLRQGSVPGQRHRQLHQPQYVRLLCRPRSALLQQLAPGPLSGGAPPERGSRESPAAPFAGAAEPAGRARLDAGHLSRGHRLHRISWRRPRGGKRHAASPGLGSLEPRPSGTAPPAPLGHGPGRGLDPGLCGDRRTLGRALRDPVLR